MAKLREEPSDYTDPPKGKSSVINSMLVPVKGINNLGNTCFFNAVMQVGTTISDINIYLLSLYVCHVCKQDFRKRPEQNLLKYKSIYTYTRLAPKIILTLPLDSLTFLASTKKQAW